MTWLTSVKASDFDRARAFIQAAIDVHRHEAQSASEDGIEHEAADERFEIEMVILDTTEALYQWMADSDFATLQPRLESIQARLVELAVRTRDKLLALEGRALRSQHDRGMITDARKSVVGRCFRSGLGAGLLVDDFCSATRLCWVGLRERAETESPPSQFAKFVLELGDAAFSDTLSSKQRRAKLDSLERKGIPKAVLLYDTARYQAMIANVRRRLGS